MGRYGMYSLRHRHSMMTRSRRDYLNTLLNRDGVRGRRNTTTDADFNKRYVIKPVKADKALNVTDIDLNKESNKVKHRTDCYENNDLIVRRGESFQITVTFDRKINQEYDKVVVQLTTGSRPITSKGSIINLQLPDSKTKTTTDFFHWKLGNVKISDKKVTFDLTPPSTCIIGTYTLFIESSLKDGEEKSRFEAETDTFHIIFNPFCPEDDVYMAKKDERDEYVMNEAGRIWVGSTKAFKGRPWNFGQFDEPCLEAALYLLDRAELKEGARRNIVSIVRTISAQANSCDDCGVLEGRWESNYPAGCTKPWAWTGSVKILQEFMNSGEPVKYGQCWVFSGVVTTLLRALGIPTRSVTNFQSAHDKDSSMTIDSHYDEEGEPIDDMDDSIWNFHVWNESWFRRSDLPDGYDGWQVHDATPQEASDRVMRCGPAPLKAIKEGHVYLNHDVPFIFSEVNGDRVFWKVSKDGIMDISDVEAHTVGKYISTKAVGRPDRHDITHLYKYSEGSPDERKVVAAVNKFSTRSDLNIYSKVVTRDVKLSVNMPVVMIGKDIDLTVKLTNTSSQSRTYHGRISIVSSYYTGLPSKRIKTETFHDTILPKLDKPLDHTIKVRVGASEYIGKLNAEASMIVYISFTVEQTGQQLAKKESLTFTIPELVIRMDKEVEARKHSEVTAFFTNPLPVNLTHPVFSFECSGVHIVDPSSNSRKPIKPGKQGKVTIKIWPVSRGKKEIEATFSSNQLSGVDGFYNFKVV